MIFQFYSKSMLNIELDNLNQYVEKSVYCYVANVIIAEQ